MVQTPSGQEWRVGRRWINRELPRWRKVRLDGVSSEAAWSIPMPDGVIDEVSSALAGGLSPSPSDAADLIRPAP
jgi:hypothetical protein